MSTSPAETVQSPLNMILPIKSWLQFKESSSAIHFREGQILGSREAVGNLHFARYVEFRDHNHLGYFAVFDGDFRTTSTNSSTISGRFLMYCSSMLSMARHCPARGTEKRSSIG